jgi:ubiquitin-like-conjugating enzyme ATG3
MSSLITAGANKFRSYREWATPTLKDSAFLTRGVLTPEEFVKAGDELVYKCPTWSWESGDEKKRKKYLPADKQYLVTRNVPCPTRVSTLENSVAVGDEDTAHIGEECGGDDWLVSRMISPEEQQRRIDEKIEEEFDILDYDEGEKKDKGASNESKSEPSLEKSVAKMTVSDNDDCGGNSSDDAHKNEEVTGEADNVVAAAEEEDDEYADMEEFEDENVMEDEAAAPSAGISDSKSNMNNFDNNIMKVRTYDLSITYDKYYQTPRVWIMGYESADSSQPLTGEQMFEDVMSDYANRTVTIDPHPHVSGYHASIHPCQHGAVMKTIVRNLTKSVEGENSEGEAEAESRGPTVEMYLFIFLKFVSSIIPTINYDFTMDVTASTEK